MNTPALLDLSRQYAKYRAEIDQAISNVLAHTKFIMGPEIEILEQALAAEVNACHCVSVSSGTHALEIVLRAADIGPGDEVITTPFTWISTAEVIPLVGAKAVFADINESTFNLDPEAVEAAITPRTRAIIAVGLFGQMPDLESLSKIAKRHGLLLIEDAAQSFGAVRNGISSCGAGCVATTSFFPTKPLGCFGDGGAIFCNNDAFASKCRAIRTHGGEVRDQHTILGTNGRFDTLQAAVLLAKLPFFREELELRRSTAAFYNSHLNLCCSTPLVDAGNTHVYAQYTIRADHRDTLRKLLGESGIPTAIFYPKCLHQQPVFGAVVDGHFPKAEAASREVLSLPIHPFLTDAEKQSVVDGMQKCTGTPSF